MSIKKIFLFLSAALLSAITVRAQIDVDRVITIGRNALYFNDYVVSIGYFNQVIGLRPWLAEPYFYRGIAKVNLEDYTGAETDASACLERNALIPKAYLLRGIARQNLGKTDSAMMDYRRGLELTPNDEGMLINLAGVLTDSKQYAEARKGVDQLLHFYPKSKQAHIVLSAIEMGEQDTTAAINELHKVLEMDSLFAPAYSQIAMLYYKNENKEKALTALDKAIELDPAELSNYINRGVIRYQSNNLRGAMADYSHVVREKPNDKLARFNRALLRSYLGDVNNAIEDFDVVIHLEPENYHAIYNRGLLLTQINENRKAIEDFDKVLAHYPDFVIGYYARSNAKKALGDNRGAEKDYWKAYDIGQSEKGKQAKKNTTKSTDKDTRDDSDKTIEKFNLLVVSEKSSERRTRYSSRIRGRIQDNDVEIQASPMFVLSYYEQLAEDEIPHFYYSQAITHYNEKKTLPKRLKATNREVALSQEQVSYHEKDITDISENVYGSADMCFRRGIDYMLIQNLEQAIVDFDQAIALKPDFSLVYFCRSVARAKLQEAKQGSSFIHKEAETVGSTALALKKTPHTNAMGIAIAPKTIEHPSPTIPDIDNELIINDLNKAIELDPDFAYAYYNRAILLARRGDIEGAIADYNRAVQVYSEFADAYFNRGLLFLSLGKAQEGISDLSRAGEHGLYKAYNIIKRMSSKS